jgi:peptidoglycan/LPS O-acetylase OafA/YrhL
MGAITYEIPESAAPARAVAAAPAPKRIPELDGLRGVAIGMVVLYHAFLFHVVPRHGSLLAYALTPVRIGWSGVDLFFVLSGFLIGGILLDARDARNYFSTFYIRRFFRIVPIYYATLLALLALSIVARYHPGVPADWKMDGLLSLYVFPLFVHNIWMAACNTMGPGMLPVFWSLGVEEQFYLTLPLLVRYCTRRRLATIAVEAILLAPILRLVLYSFLPKHPLAWFVLMPCRADSLFFGVLAAVALRDVSCKAWLAAHRSLLRAVIVIFALGLPFVTQTDMLANGLFMVSLMLSWLAAFYCLVLVYAMSFPDSLPARCLRWPWLRWLGTIAYGMYLLHIMVLSLVVDYLGAALHLHSPLAQLLAASLAIAVTWALSSASWLYFEKPLVARGHRLIYESDSRTSVLSAEYSAAPVAHS